MASAPVHNRSSGPVPGTFPMFPGAIIVPVRRELFTDLIAPDAGGGFGVAMCFLPVDVSLRAYTIEAFCRIANEHGLDVGGWRNVPLSRTRDDVHVAQFVLTSLNVVDEAALERSMADVHAAISHEFVSMGLDDDARVVSCSCQWITYPSLDGMTPPETWYVDLTGDEPRLPMLSVPDA